MNINFGVEFAKLGMATISHDFKIHQIRFELKTKNKIKVIPTTEIMEKGQVIGTLNDLAEFCFQEGTKKKLRPYLNRNFLKVYKTRADLEKTALIEHRVPINGISVKVSEEESIDLISVIIILIGKPKVCEVEVKHRKYDKALITEGTFASSEFEKEFTIFTAQTPKSDIGKYFIKTKNRK